MSAKETKEDAKLLNVYQAIAMVQGKLAVDGIGKGKQNKEQGYKFRGIDDVYNALAPILAEVKLCILPRIISRDFREGKTSKGNPLFFVTVDAEFDFVSAEDGSKHVVKTYGEAMDTADKATNKAMSAAYKYACLQTFCIPTEGDNDADAVTHEVAPRDVIFATPQDRKKFTEDCIFQIDKSSALDALKSVRTGNLAKWNTMGASQDKADCSAWDLIKDAYNKRFAALKAASPSPSATVDAAVKAPVTVTTVLGDDEIPF